MDSNNTTDQIGKRLRTITADLKMYIEKRAELMLLVTGEYMASWIAASIHRAAGAFLLLGGVCFLLFALAIYVGNLLDSESLGYVLVSLPLLIFGFLFLYLKPKAIFKKLEEELESEVIKAISKSELEKPAELPDGERKSEPSN